jgi:starch phosphorylase
MNIREFTVVPTLPERLRPLRALAMNVWWSWNPEAQDLFRRLDPALWEEVEGNPVKLLNTIAQQRLTRAAADSAVLGHLDRVMETFHGDMEAGGWFDQTWPDLGKSRIAYFSAEFGMHESIPLYSGGLGILAGDHLKTASDLAVPIIGVSLLYQYGYFHQHLAHDGLQFEEYPPVDLPYMPATCVTAADGSPLRVQVEIAGRTAQVQLWKIQVGRVSLVLMDTHLPENAPEDREITGRLYGGDQDMRIRQEIVLGIGGIRALRAMRLEPDICHMNEGHCAFLALEQMRHLMTSGGLSLSEAREAVIGSTLFTTHTPVPAGIDTFPPELVEAYLRPYAGQLHMSLSDLIAMGQLDRSRPHEPFSMAILALRLASRCNGVSKLHGSVARKMWQPMWTEVPLSEVPITSITNGVHIRTWQGGEIGRLFERYLGPDWSRNPNDADVWERVSEIPDAELWQAHERLREQLVAFTRRRLKRQLQKRGAPVSRIDDADAVLDPEALTIGFARRFATYKRAGLFLSQPDRLEAILTNPDAPVQFVFAGKAHPRDEVGKRLIQSIIQFARRDTVRRRIVFIEDYSMSIARALVQGCDVWLNNPIKPLEASGTSGMKVTPNGGINFSILDGWWPEAFDGTNGWAIGDDRSYDHQDYQDRVDSASLYDQLEREIVPAFYDRGTDGLPRDWIRRMKASMRVCCGQFSANRMVREYVDQLYAPTLARAARLSAEGYAAAKALAAWRQRITDRWGQVQIVEVSTEDGGTKPVGGTLLANAKVRLGEVSASDVAVELYHGPLAGIGELGTGAVTPMRPEGDSNDGIHSFVGEISCTHTGRQGFAVRVVPRHQDLAGPHATQLIRWG